MREIGNLKRFGFSSRFRFIFPLLTLHTASITSQLLRSYTLSISLSPPASSLACFFVNLVFSFTSRFFRHQLPSHLTTALLLSSRPSRCLSRLTCSCLSESKLGVLQSLAEIDEPLFLSFPSLFSLEPFNTRFPPLFALSKSHAIL